MVKVLRVEARVLTTSMAELMTSGPMPSAGMEAMLKWGG
jgi:hypothetical protein